MVFAERREIQFISIYIIAMVFFGISKETTRFFFPDTPDRIYSVINFYFVSAVALISVISWLALSHNIPQVPKVPPLWAVGINFVLFSFIFYPGFAWLFTGGTDSSTMPTLPNIVIETTISFNENFIAFILLPALLSWGKGTGSIYKGTILTKGGYTLGYDIPTFSRMKYLFPSISIITLLHVGSYSQNITSFSQFYTALVIVFIMFFVFAFIKETVGFGASEGSHAAWNLALSSVKGSISYPGVI